MPAALFFSRRSKGSQEVSLVRDFPRQVNIGAAKVSVRGELAVEAAFGEGRMRG
jgi:hypothetical protein